MNKPEKLTPESIRKKPSDGRTNSRPVSKTPFRTGRGTPDLSLATGPDRRRPGRPYRVTGKATRDQKRHRQCRGKSKIEKIAMEAVLVPRRSSVARRRMSAVKTGVMTSNLETRLPVSYALSRSKGELPGHGR